MMILHAAFTKRCRAARDSPGPISGRRHGEQTARISRVCRASREGMERQGKNNPILLEEGNATRRVS